MAEQDLAEFQEEDLQNYGTIFQEPDLVAYSNNFSKTLGIGGYGIVYEGHIPANNNYQLDEKAVAIKAMLNPNERTKKQFDNEIYWLSTTSHDHIIHFVGQCRTQTRIYIVCELATNGNLLERLRGLDWKQTLSILKGVAQAIDYMHSREARHGDLKTANVLLNENYQSKLTDFGTVKSLHPNRNSYLARAFQNRQLDSLTPGFYDPISNALGNCRLSDDIYSFGVIILQLITKRELGDPADFMDRIGKEKRAGKIIVHSKLRVSGCSVKDATDITTLALELTEPLNFQTRKTIEDVIKSLHNLVPVERSSFEKKLLKAKLIGEKVISKFSFT